MLFLVSWVRILELMQQQTIKHLLCPYVQQLVSFKIHDTYVYGLTNKQTDTYDVSSLFSSEVGRVRKALNWPSEDTFFNSASSDFPSSFLVRRVLQRNKLTCTFFLLAKVEKTTQHY